MGKSSKFILFSLTVTFLLHQAISTRPTNPCSSRSPSWKDLGGDFCYIVDVNHTVPWIDAVHRCFSEGGSLTSFHSLEEIRRIVDYVNDEKMRLYIGLRKNNDGTFSWVDKTAFDFANWYPGEPNIPDEKCMEIYIESGQWNDIDCDKKFGYICSVPKNSPRSRRKKVCLGTSTKWEDFGGDVCYIIESGDKATWDDASRRCTRKGGSLASFHSIEEISAVLQHTRQYHEEFHIGLRLNDDGKHEWSDMSPVDLDYWDVPVDVYYWDVGESNTEEKKCVQMGTQSGQWTDVSCGKVSGYICSSPKGVCGGNIFSESGIISSPNYPKKYRKNENCVWKITVPERHQVVLEFQTFQMEAGYDCRYDFVEISDGHRLDSPVLGKFCGANTPEAIRSSTNKMKVTFVTDALYQRRGFLATFEKATNPNSVREI